MQDKSSQRFKSGFLVACCALSMSFSCICEAQVGGDDPPAAIQLHATASNLFDAGNYQLAAEQWTQLLKDYPQFSEGREARLFLGLSYSRLKQFKQAETELKKLRASLDSLKDFGRSDRMLFFLAFSQYSLGLSDETSRAKFDEAIETYATFFENFPNSDLADQALYFRGETEYELGDRDAAAKSFQNIVENHKNSVFFNEAFYVWGVCLEELARYQDARTVYNRYLERFPDDKKTHEVRFRSADSLLQLAIAGESDDPDQSQRQFATASSVFEALSEDEAFADVDRALFHQAFCQLRLKQTENAAQLYAKVASEHASSPLAEQATLAAGKYFFSAGDPRSARRWLEQVVENKTAGFVEAAHWLARIHLEAKRFTEAFEIASTALTAAADNPFRENLMMDAADALYGQPQRKAESVQYYLNLANEFPMSELSPTSLYYAAFASMETGDSAEAIKLAEQFKRTFKNSSYLPDIMQVHGECLLKEKDFAAARDVFSGLVRDFSRHASADFWRTRMGWSLYLQDDFAGVLSLLRPLAGDMADPINQSESFYLVGASEFQTEKFEEAVASFSAALQANPNRSNADEVRLLTARSHFHAGDSAQAISVARGALDDSGGSLKYDVLYWLGEFAYQSGKYADATGYYSQVVDAGPEASKLYRNCLSGTAWAQLKSNQSDQAARTFSSLIDRFPNDPLATDALIGRGVSRRNSGDFAGSLDDLDRFLASNPDDEKKTSAQYERGLALVGMQNWDAAIAALSSVVKTGAPPELVDDVLYELAWAYKNNGDDVGANKQFLALADNHPDSQFAAESDFHVGQQRYNEKKYDDAISRYERSLNKTTDDAIAEKAVFKLGWSYFQKEDFDRSLESFREQIRRFPDGSLNADGLFMIAESLYRSDGQHGEAVVAYKKAIDVVNASDSVQAEVKLLAPIHAAQSANKNKEYAEALAFAQPLVDQHPNSEYAPEAWYEIGVAHKGLGSTDQAISAWEKAVMSVGKTGARARCMMGEAYFEQRNYDEAIKQFTLVVHGAYGGDMDEIQRWQAFAAYEAARCNYVQIRDETDDSRRAALIANAKQMFEHLVKSFPNDRLSEDARKQLRVLQGLK